MRHYAFTSAMLVVFLVGITDAALSARKLSKYVRCDVCLKLSDQLTKEMESLANDHQQNRHSSRNADDKLVDVIEDLCDPASLAGVWLTRLDIKGVEGRLSLQENTELGHCQTECQAVAKACQTIRTEAGVQELAQRLRAAQRRFENANELSGMICKKMSSACKDAVPLLKKPRTDEPFPPMSIQEQRELLQLAVRRSMQSGRSVTQEQLQYVLASQPGAYEGRARQAQPEAQPEDEEYRRWKQNAYWWEIKVADLVRLIKRTLWEGISTAATKVFVLIRTGLSSASGPVPGSSEL